MKMESAAISNEIPLEDTFLPSEDDSDEWEPNGGTSPRFPRVPASLLRTPKSWASEATPRNKDDQAVASIVGGQSPRGRSANTSLSNPNPDAKAVLSQNTCIFVKITMVAAGVVVDGRRIF